MPYVDPKLVGCDVLLYVPDEWGHAAPFWRGQLPNGASWQIYRLGCFVALHQPDGVMSLDVLRRWIGVRPCLEEVFREVVEWLVNYGLWEQIDGGMRVVTGYVVDRDGVALS